MIIDGKAIAAEIYEEVKGAAAKLPRPPQLTALTCAPNFETRSYLELKKRKATQVGIRLNVVEIPESAETSDAVACVERLLPECDGLVVQLPLPTHIDREAVLAVVPPEKDPDGFSYGALEASCLPPVAAAIDEIAKRHGVVWQDAAVTVIGFGRLVGKPAAHLAEQRGANVTVLERGDDLALLAEADIIISGVGHPHLVTKDMVKEGVVVFDAGTSEDGGELVGDVHPAVAEVASLMTPVPGGIGPITVAALFKNLLSLIRQ